MRISFPVFKVSFIITGACDHRDSNDNEIFNRIATATKGQIIQFDPNHAETVPVLIETSSKPPQTTTQSDASDHSEETEIATTEPDDSGDDSKDGFDDDSGNNSEDDSEDEAINKIDIHVPEQNVKIDIVGNLQGNTVKPEVEDDMEPSTTTRNA